MARGSGDIFLFSEADFSGSSGAGTESGIGAWVLRSDEAVSEANRGKGWDRGGEHNGSRYAASCLS